ncbi:hypothetical protein CANINC_004289 [Pichia inconspicua]|uniref:Nucleolar 27S pre-rRNA processing Urb2/Npa2 C-terminal domain-containing protein n=1 Tax=Pichia inconspicua TaxID=52247 RepID=A0A4T0WXI6_9ASCO|nr:hypothetical protein CANINC_004289 [[Candida] inconspicua]
MVTETQLENTESITRYLRSKDSKINEIYEFVTKSLFASDQHGSPLILPQKEKFVLELLVDRITQTNKQSQHFKYSSKTWKLLNLVWKSCEIDSRLINIRTNVLARIKFGETFSKLLTEISTQELFEDRELIQELTISMNYLLQLANTHLSDEQNVNIITDLLTFAMKRYDLVTLRINLVELAFKIFKMNNRGSLNYDSKHRSEFVRSCFVHALLLSNDKELESVKVSLKSIIIQVLFAEGKNGTSVNIVTFVQQLLKATNMTVLQTENLLYLLQLIINKVKLEELEESVKLLVDAFPGSSSALIQEVANLNKTLSTEFLSNLVEKSLSISSNESYELIRYAIKRSSDITFKFADDICKLCAIPNERSYLLFCELFDSFSRNREIEAFINLWTKLAKDYPNSIFTSDAVLDYVASKLVTLPFIQLSRLVDLEVEAYRSNSCNEPVFLLAVAKCFLMGVSGSVQNSLSRTLVLNLHAIKPKLTSLLHIKGESGWKVKFYIATLFDLEDINEDVQIAKNHPIVASDYFYFFQLRIIEQDINNVDSNIVNNLKNYFLKKSNSKFQLVIFSRFFMMIEYLYNKQDIKLMLNKLCDSEADIREVVENPLFQAQPQIISGLIDLFNETANLFHFLKYISVYAFSKAQREITLNLALTRLDSSGIIIKHLLKVPTYKSKIETDFKALLQLVGGKRMYQDIAREIILLNGKRSSESQPYFQSIYEDITRAFDELSVNNCSYYKSHIEIALLIFKTHDSFKNAEIVESITSRIVKLFNDPTKLQESDMVLLLKFLTELNFLGISRTIPNISKQTIIAINDNYKQSKMIENALFGLICSGQYGYSAEYILSLYIVLDIESILYLEKFISNIALDQKKHLEIWNNLSKSIQDSNTEDLKKYLTIYGIFLKCTKKHDETEYILSAHNLFVASLSNILTKILEIRYVTREVLEFIESLKIVTSAKTWLITQYAMEQILVLVNETLLIINQQEDEIVSEIFVSLCQVVASIILYHRKRLSNRQHLIISVLISFMRTLFKRSGDLSSECAASFERLTSNFCEPTVNQISVKHTEHAVSKEDELNDALSSTKKILRKHIAILLFNYIKLYLQYPVELSIKVHIDNSVYMMLDLLTLNELNYINQSLDNQGLFVFKNIYENYKQFYKWTEE